MTILGSHTPVAAFAGVRTLANNHRSLQILTKNAPYALPAVIPNSASTARIASNTALNSLNPIALLGGAAQDTLGPAAVVTMALLAIQYCAQPPLTRKFLDRSMNKKGITMVEEICKMGFSAIFLLSMGKDVVASSLKGWTLQSSLLLAGLPAVLYATQGVLTYLGYQHTDSVTFNGLNQTKTLSAALWCYLLMGKRQSAVQIVALGILVFSAILFQGTISFSSLFGKSKDKSKDMKEEGHKQTSFSKGILPCLGAAGISGLAGALSQKGVQVAGGSGRNPYFYTMELGLYSCISLIISLFATKNGRKALREEGGVFKHWKPLSIIPVAVRAFGGILTALVHKYAGATRKGYALIAGLIMTGLTQSIIEGERLSFDEILAVAFVILSSYLHLNYPPITV